MSARTIFKYQHPVDDSFEVRTFFGAALLDVQMQHGLIALWFLVDTSREEQVRRFRVYGTGQPFGLDDYRHVGTVQDVPYVWHIFEDLAR